MIERGINFKKCMKMIVVVLLYGAFTNVSAQEADEIISVYEGSRVIHDDEIGFDAYPVITGDETINIVEGYLRRRFALPPEGRSAYDVIQNYRAAIEGLGGTIIYSTRDARSQRPDGKRAGDYFFQSRVNHTRNEHYMAFPRGFREYLAGKITTAQYDLYVIVAAGTGFQGRPAFELVTLEAEPMIMDMVTLEGLQQGIDLHGRVAVYDIFFDTGSHAVKSESDEALRVIAQYLNNNPARNFLVVGHTDNTGGYDMNMELSVNRARSVVEKLVSDHGVGNNQIKAVGVGPAAPVTSNTSDEGKALNRRVEIVEF